MTRREGGEVEIGWRVDKQGKSENIFHQKRKWELMDETEETTGERQTESERRDNRRKIDREREKSKQMTDKGRIATLPHFLFILQPLVQFGLSVKRYDLTVIGNET